MDDLVKFLRYRLREAADRAELALSVAHSPYGPWSSIATELHASCESVPQVDRAGQHLTHNANPARTLAEIDARLRLVEDYAQAAAAQQKRDAGDGEAAIEWARAELVARTLRPHVQRLALSYANHPDFRARWRP